MHTKIEYTSTPARALAGEGSRLSNTKNRQVLREWCKGTVDGECGQAQGLPILSLHHKTSVPTPLVESEALVSPHRVSVSLSVSFVCVCACACACVCVCLCVCVSVCLHTRTHKYQTHTQTYNMHTKHFRSVHCGC